MSENTALAMYNDDMPVAYNPGNATTLQVVDKETRKLVANAANNADSLAKQGDAVLEVLGIIMQPGIMRSRDRNTPDRICTNTTLICADGRAFMTQSEGIRKAADILIASGVFDDGEPVPMHVASKSLDNGNTIKTLVLD